jgi:hypothetical protein
MYYCYILGKHRQALEVGQYASKILTYIGQFKKEVGTHVVLYASPVASFHSH